MYGTDSMEYINAQIIEKEAKLIVTNAKQNKIEELLNDVNNNIVNKQTEIAEFTQKMENASNDVEREEARQKIQILNQELSEFNSLKAEADDQKAVIQNEIEVINQEVANIKVKKEEKQAQIDDYEKAKVAVLNPPQNIPAYIPPITNPVSQVGSVSKSNELVANKPETITTYGYFTGYTCKKNDKGSYTRELTNIKYSDDLKFTKVNCEKANLWYGSTQFKNCKVHVKAANQFNEAFSNIEKLYNDGILDRNTEKLLMGGTTVIRHTAGTKKLSDHSWGTAIDINDSLKIGGKKTYSGMGTNTYNSYCEIFGLKPGEEEKYKYRNGKLWYSATENRSINYILWIYAF